MTNNLINQLDDVKAKIDSLEINIQKQKEELDNLKTMLNQLIAESTKGETSTNTTIGICENITQNQSLSMRIQEEVKEDEFLWEKTTIGCHKGVRITKYIGFDKERIIIPNTIHGFPVISIGKDVFKFCHMNSISLPESLVEICDNAFYCCYDLNDIALPSSLTAIGPGAFHCCSNLTDIIIPENVETLGDGCFERTGIHSIKFPIYIKQIPQNCCRSCQQLSAVSISNGVRSIGHEAFLETNISKILIPSTVDTIGDEVFKDSLLQHIAFLGKATGPSKSRHCGPTRIFGIWVKPTVYAYPNSTMQSYAREFNCPVKPLTEFFNIL